MLRCRLYILVLVAGVGLALAGGCGTDATSAVDDDLGSPAPDADATNVEKDLASGGDDAPGAGDTSPGADPGGPGEDTAAPDVTVHEGLVLLDLGHDAAPDTAASDTAPDTAVTDVDPLQLDHFSFFVTSLASLIQLSGNSQGFGGDLSFGETGAGAGLRGADKICATIAELSMPGSSAKEWRAFLSVTDDGAGQQLDAIDRIGEGPWYDRLGRLFANNKAELMYDRPQNANSLIKNDFPNEWGVPNHRPDPTKPEVDNHDMLTGSNKQGRLYSATATCKDWTAKAGNTTTEGKPRVGHSWPTGGMGGGGGETMAAPGPGGDQDMANWMSALTENGCAAGINLASNPPTGDPSEKTVGAGGGYGGFYCFARVP